MPPVTRHQARTEAGFGNSRQPRVVQWLQHVPPAPVAPPSAAQVTRGSTTVDGTTTTRAPPTRIKQEEPANAAGKKTAATAPPIRTKQEEAREISLRPRPAANAAHKKTTATAPPTRLQKDGPSNVAGKKTNTRAPPTRIRQDEANEVFWRPGPTARLEPSISSYETNSQGSASESSKEQGRRLADSMEYLQKLFITRSITKEGLMGAMSKILMTAMLEHMKEAEREYNDLEDDFDDLEERHKQLNRAHDKLLRSHKQLEMRLARVAQTNQRASQAQPTTSSTSLLSGAQGTQRSQAPIKRGLDQPHGEESKRQKRA